MRMIFEQAARYPGEFVAQQWSDWRSFITTPVDGTMLGPVRLTLGLLATWNWFVMGLDFSDWFGPFGWLPKAESIALRHAAIPWGWSFWDIVPQSLVAPVYGLGLILILAWTVGFCCRWSGVITWLLIYSTMRRLPMVLFGFDSILGTFVLYLALTGTGGESLSIDRWLASRNGFKPIQNKLLRSTVAIRLIQIHLCVIYGAAGLSKLRGEPWWSGTASFFLVANSEFRGVSILETLGNHRMITALFTHIPLWTEILYPVLIWPKLWRPLILILTVGLHLAIGLTLGLWEFGFAMIVANLVFIDGAWLKVVLRSK
ncbi:MAG: HTTM domain-containing protein [Planctomycetota bacterium]|nr:HTTM domain-containing protein [Planctomycetota bacterium]